MMCSSPLYPVICEGTCISLQHRVHGCTCQLTNFSSRLVRSLALCAVHVLDLLVFISMATRSVILRARRTFFATLSCRPLSWFRVSFLSSLNPAVLLRSSCCSARRALRFSARGPDPPPVLSEILARTLSCGRSASPAKHHE